jgi:hypothetical protein
MRAGAGLGLAELGGAWSVCTELICYELGLFVPGYAEL